MQLNIRKNTHSLRTCLAAAILLIGTFHGLGRAGQQTCSNTQACQSLRIFARLFYGQGQFERADHYGRQALKIALDRQMPDRQVALCLLELGTIEQGRAFYDSAYEYVQTAVNLLERQEPINSTLGAYAYRSLSSIQKDMGDYTAAHASMAKALELIRLERTSDISVVAAFEVDQAKLCLASGDYSRSMDLFNRSIETIENTYGPEMLYTAMVYGEMARMELALGRIERAEAFIGQCVPKQRDVYKKVNPLWVGDLITQAQIQAIEGHFDEAMGLYNEAFSCMHTHYYLHPTTGRILNGQAGVLLKQGDVEQARYAIDEALRIFEETLGSDHVQYQIAANRKAKILLEEGDIFSARMVCMSAAEKLEAVFDHPHLSLAQVYETLAEIESQTGQAELGEELLTKSEEIRRQCGIVTAVVAKADQNDS